MPVDLSRMSRDQLDAYLAGLGDAGEQLARRLNQVAPSNGRGELRASDVRKLNRLERDVEEWERRTDDVGAELEKRQRMDDALQQIPRAQVTGEPTTYRPRGEHSFYRDMYAAKQGDPDAQTRLARHRAETRDLDTGTASVGEFVPPQHLQEEWAALARAGRVYANQVRSIPLRATGMTFTVPRVTAGASTAMQTENTAVSETDPTTDEISIPVRTVAGQVDLSRQAFERSDPGLDEVIFADLAASFAVTLDTQLLNGNGTAPNVEGVLNNANINTVTFTSAAPTAGSLYPRVADAINQVHIGRFMAPDAIFMHPRRWAWLLAALDSGNRPFVTPYAPQNALARTGPPASEGLVGSLQGVDVFADPNVPTNLGAGLDEDAIIVTRLGDHLLAESGPRTRVFESVLSSTLTIRLQVYGYVAYTSDRYGASTTKITGTGLVEPVFA